MILQDEDVNEFQRLYAEEFGEPISLGDARLLAIRLITLYEALARRLPSEEQLAGFEDPGNIDRMGDAAGEDSARGNLPQKVVL